MRRLLLTVPLPVLLLLLLGPPLASAAYEQTTLRASEPVARSCTGDLPAAAAGTDAVRWTAPAAGYLGARLSGGRAGDWDLAVVERPGGETRAVSTSFGSDEQATLWVEKGDRLEIQACRRAGGRARVPLSIDLNEMQMPEASDETFTLERVAIGGSDDLDRLYRLGADVTHAISAESAIVATYSDAERASLRSAGFTLETVEDDLAAKDARSRAIEGRRASAGIASSLPSGNEAYRTYPAYTNDMKELAESYPGHVRPLIIGETYEGRTIQGLEIAGRVEREDGRPVYLNMGAHHAREWPSAEFPMEFAIDLAERYGKSERVTKLLDRVRVVIIPVVNVDGFIASRSFGTSPLDDDSIATLPQAATNSGAYIRKNCRPTLGDGAIPCALRTGSGVDPNRNYGAYWGGEGASTDPSSQGYRGTEPFSEPETQAMRKFMAKLNPIINITNHTFTEEGEWLRQPGFEHDPITDPDGDGVHDVPDGPVHEEIGDAMADATGWQSNKSTILGSITGATEDWNYYVQSAYGFTPEGRGPNFHGTFSNAVVTEYEGDAGHAGEGVYEAFLRAGEIASRAANHSIVEGEAPAGAKLKLIRDFETPVFTGDPVDDHLEVTMEVRGSGRYKWHVGPSSRPLHTGEAYTMTCKQPGGETVSQPVVVDRGERVTVDWASGDACGKATEPPPGPEPGTCAGEDVTIAGTGDDDVLRGTPDADVISARGGSDKVRGRGGNDVVCGGSGNDKLRGNAGRDKLRGGDGRDKLWGGADSDALAGGPDRDRLDGGRDADRCAPGARKAERDKLKRCES